MYICKKKHKISAKSFALHKIAHLHKKGKPKVGCLPGYDSALLCMTVTNKFWCLSPEEILWKSKHPPSYRHHILLINMFTCSYLNTPTAEWMGAHIWYRIPLLYICSAVQSNLIFHWVLKTPLNWSGGVGLHKYMTLKYIYQDVFISVKC